MRTYELKNWTDRTVKDISATNDETAIIVAEGHVASGLCVLLYVTVLEGGSDGSGRTGTPVMRWIDGVRASSKAFIGMLGDPEKTRPLLERYNGTLMTTTEARIARMRSQIDTASPLFNLSKEDALVLLRTAELISERRGMYVESHQTYIHAFDALTYMLAATRGHDDIIDDILAMRQPFVEDALRADSPYSKLDDLEDDEAYFGAATLAKINAMQKANGETGNEKQQ